MFVDQLIYERELEAEIVAREIIKDVKGVLLEKAKQGYGSYELNVADISEGDATVFSSPKLLKYIENELGVKVRHRREYREPTATRLIPLYSHYLQFVWHSL